jgi:hypothetical protein
MVERRYPRNRGVRPLIRRMGKAVPPTHRKIVQHPLYGEIPLIRQSATGLDGRSHDWWTYDPAFQPTLPSGAVRGEVDTQVSCGGFHVPKYFFVDEERTCVQCGASFIFRAAEQKYWYEVLKFHFASVPVRCLACRRRRRSEHALREQIARSRAHVRAAADDPAAHLSLARAIVEYRERTGQGNLNEAVAAARRAAVLWREAGEPLFWEGAAQALAGRGAKARECLRLFLSEPGLGTAALKQRARGYLEGA